MLLPALHHRCMYSSFLQSYPTLTQHLLCHNVRVTVCVFMQVDKEEMLDVFRFDPNFEENEMLWEQIKKEILGDDDEDDEDAENEEDGE